MKPRKRIILKRKWKWARVHSIRMHKASSTPTNDSKVNDEEKIMYANILDKLFKTSAIFFKTIHF